MPMEIVDAHHHLWDTERLDYELFRSLPVLLRPYTNADFELLAARHGVSGSVLVEAASAGADGWRELLWLLEQAKGSRIVKRIVAWAPLERPDVSGYLERLTAAADGLVVGVRRSFEFEPPEFAASAGMITGAKTAARHGYSVDLVLFERSLAAALQLVEACPEVRFVLDHLGKPRIREGVLHPWWEQIAQLAQAPNVMMKISGLITEADRAHWTKEQLKPYIDHAIACFGWDRVLFGSDWPVSTLAGGYDPWVEAAVWATAGAGESDRRKFFSENAKRVYRF